MFDPVLTAPLAVQLHVFAALTALALTPVQLWRRPGDRPHKGLGYVWVTAMALTALSSFWIQEMRLLGPFSPIHLLSAWVLFTLVAALRAVRRGNVAAHRRWLQSSAFWGLGVAGLFTLLPSRRMSETLFQEQAWAGFAAGAIAVVLVTVALRARQARLRGS